VDGLVKDDSLIEVFAANVNIRGTSSHCSIQLTNNLQQAYAGPFSVISRSLHGSGLTFVSIDYQKGRTTVGFLGHETPLQPRRKTSTTDGPRNPESFISCTTIQSGPMRVISLVEW
jgi:hypothetical protein